MVVAVVLVAAIGSLIGVVATRHTGGSTQAATTVATTSAPAGSGSTTTAAAGGARPGVLVGVTIAGAVVSLDPSTGAIVRTLVPSGAVGDAVSVSPDGKTVYYAVAQGCEGEVYAVPTAGGTPVAVTSGSLPAVRPDGKALALAREPDTSLTSCIGTGNIATKYTVVVRNLTTGAERVYPAAPQLTSTGLPVPVSHLSWSADGSHLAVALSSVEDNEGWNLAVMAPATATYYYSSSATTVPVTGSQASQSYYREGIFLPNGGFFVVRLCCTGVPPKVTSVSLQEVQASGAVAQVVAVGFTDRDHTSLAVDPSGRWLLYLSGTDLEVSQGGHTPTKLASGLVAAAW